MNFGMAGNLIKDGQQMFGAWGKEVNVFASTPGHIFEWELKIENGQLSKDKKQKIIMQNVSAQLFSLL